MSLILIDSRLVVLPHFVFVFFFNDTATTEIYTLSLHDALPLFRPFSGSGDRDPQRRWVLVPEDRKSTRLNSSHVEISYAVFCLKKKKIHLLGRDERHEHAQPADGRHGPPAC